jgi:hypothetical protein
LETISVGGEGRIIITSSAPEMDGFVIRKCDGETNTQKGLILI